jgi:1,4-alpha-glucan branching enzyme
MREGNRPTDQQANRRTGEPASAEAAAGKQANRATSERARRQYVVAVVNFTPVPRRGYRLGVPAGGHYIELLNSDADVYGGSNIGNTGKVTAEKNPSHGHEWSLNLTVPPLGFLLLKPNN